MTILIAFINGFLLYTFGKDLIEKQDPEVTNLREFTINIPALYFSSDNSPFTFELQDYYTWKPIRDPSIFFIEYQIY
jgi:hypothetical protein